MPLENLANLMNTSSQNLSQVKGISIAYDTLLGGVPTIDGYTALINTNNTTNFGAGPTGPDFNDENIYINIANALYQGNIQAQTAFDGIVVGQITTADKLDAIYDFLIPASAKSDTGRAYFKSQADYYTARAAELDIAGSNGPALVGFAALAKIAVDNDIPGLGDGVGDLIAAINDGSAQIPQSGNVLTPLETADGTNHDGDDAGAGSEDADDEGTGNGGEGGDGGGGDPGDGGDGGGGGGDPGGGGGIETFVVDSAALTAAAVDKIVDFDTGTDKIDFGGAAGGALNYLELAAPVLDFNSALIAANVALALTIRYVEVADGNNVYIFHDQNGDGLADNAVQLTGGTLASVTHTDII